MIPLVVLLLVYPITCQIKEHHVLRGEFFTFGGHVNINWPAMWGNFSWCDSYVPCWYKFIDAIYEVSYFL